MKEIQIIWIEDKSLKFNIDDKLKDIEDFNILKSFIITKLNRLKKGLIKNE